MTNNSFWPSNECWKRHWPARIIALIAVIQLFFSFAIMLLHIAIVIIGIIIFCIGAAPWFIMGFVCWIIFLACWISVFCVTCCNRSSVGCATYVMIKNLIAFIFSAVLIDFDYKFINGGLGSYSMDYYILGCQRIYSQGTDFFNIMLSLTKGQLAGSVIMLVSCLVFIAIYVYVYIRSLMDERAGFNNSFPRGTHQRPTVVLPEQSWTSQPAEATIYPRESINMDTNIIHSHDYSQTIVCPTCDTKMIISDQL